MPTFLFLNKSFLLGLFAVAIPLLIHLFTKKKARKLDFSTVDFIRYVARRETKRLRVRNLLLMVLRTAAIASFVLAMARPAFVGPLIKGKGSTAVVVVLDNSASMGWLKEGKSLFTYACDAARQILGGLGDNDEGGLIPVCADPADAPEGIPESPTLIAGSARLVGMVGLVNLSNSSSPPQEALNLAYSLLGSSKNINKELYIVSDFQGGQWQNLESSQLQRAPERREQQERGPRQLEPARRGQPRRERLRREQLHRKGIRTTLVSVLPYPSDSQRENLSIEKAEIIPQALGQEQMLEFVVANHGRSDARGIPVRVLSSGKEIAVKYLDVEPHGSAKVTLRLALGFGEASPRGINVVLPPDGFPLDNSYSVALQRPRQTDVLIVGDEGVAPARKTSDERGFDVDFVSLALRPAATGTVGNIWGFVPRRVSANELYEAELRRAKCVILENVSRLSGHGLDLLREFKDSGGKLLIVLGDRTDIRYYNESLLPALFPARLVGVEGTPPQTQSPGDGQGSEGKSKEGKSKEQSGFFSLVATIASHPILRSFDVSRGEAVSGARFYRVVRVEGLRGSTVVAEFSQGLPAILEAEGALLFTSSFEPEWNDLVMSGAFLPLLHEMLMYLCGGGALAGRDFHPGDALEEELPAGEAASLSFVDPNGKELRTSKTRLGTSLLVKSEPMHELGIYKLFADNEEVSAISVNVDPVESRFDPLSKRELLKAFPGASVVSEDSRSELAGVARPGQELWPFFLILCLGLLVAEVIVARSIAPSE